MAAYADEAFIVDFFWGPTKWSRGESLRITAAEFSDHGFWAVNGSREELPVHDQRWLAAEQKSGKKQRVIASHKDPLWGANLDTENLLTGQCCMQKALAHSSLHVGHTVFDSYTVKTPALGRCCSFGLCCSCDCGCGELRSLKFRCLCCVGEFTHRYPVYETLGHDEFGAPPLTYISVTGWAGMMTGATSAEDLTVTIDPPRNASKRQMQLLLALGYDIALTYLKPF